MIEPKPHPLVLPEEFDSDDSGDSGGEVIDLRNLKMGNRVRFAVPQAARQLANPKVSAEDQLKKLYAQDKSLQDVKKDQARESLQNYNSSQAPQSSQTADQSQDSSQSLPETKKSSKIEEWDPYAS